MRVVDFLQAEDGAVTVDWTVLTGGIVGLGMAATAVISSGVENVATEITTDLSGRGIFTAFTQLVSNSDFEAGVGAWVGGILGSSSEYGGIMGPFGGSDGLQTVRREFDLVDDHQFAVLEFDFHAIDSWDNEGFMIFANDVHVATANFHYNDDGATGTWVSDNPDINFAVSTASARENVGYSNEWSDQSHRMQVTVRNPGDSISFGFGSTLDQGVGDESWAVDNVSVVSTNDPVH